MKTVLLLATALTIVLAQNATDDGLKDGETKCENDMNGDGKIDADEFMICKFHQECVESTNKSWSGCVPKGNKVCYTYSKGGESGVIVGVTGIVINDADGNENVIGELVHPSSSCCDGAVCSSRQTCVEVNDPSKSFNYDLDEDGIPIPYNVGEVARNGWRNAKGEGFDNKPKVCVNKVFDGAPRPLLKHTALVAHPSPSHATAAPARLGSPPPLRRAQSPRAPSRSSRRGARWSSSSSRSSSCSSRTRTGSSRTPPPPFPRAPRAAPARARRRRPPPRSLLIAARSLRGSMLLPLIVLVASFFLALSEAWIFALFTAFVAVATTSTSAEHQGKLVLFLLAFVWLYFGGMNLLFAYPTSDTPNNYFLLAARGPTPTGANSILSAISGLAGIGDRRLQIYDLNPDPVDNLIAL